MDRVRDTKSLLDEHFLQPASLPHGCSTNYSRKHDIATEKLSIIQVHQIQNNNQLMEPWFIGLFIEGFRWELRNHQMAQLPNQVISELPMIHILPTESTEKVASVYECPLFKVQERKGVLSTTGCSTNFIVKLELPSRKKEEDWMKNRAVAFLSNKLWSRFSQFL